MIMELLDEGYIDTAKVQEISQYIRIRYFDKNNELHEEWLSTKEPPKYQSHFMPGQTVEIVENGSYIGLISERSEAVPMPELSEDFIISSREVLMDRNAKCITKLPVPKDKYTFYKDFYDQRDKNREDF